MTGEVVRVTSEDPTLPTSRQLIAELSADLGARYGDDGSGAFSIEDVMIPRAAFVVAWLDDRAVGCGALRPMSEPYLAEVKRMFVRPEARGRGISRRILGMLERLARDDGYTTIWLETGTLQPEAISLYETSGYVRIPCYGQYADNPLSVCYEKTL